MAPNSNGYLIVKDQGTDSNGYLIVKDQGTEAVDCLMAIKSSADNVISTRFLVKLILFFKFFNST